MNRKIISIGITILLFSIVIITVPEKASAQLPTPNYVVGYIYDSNGDPYPNSPNNSVAVTTYYGTTYTQTDEDGYYNVTVMIPAPPGDPTITVNFDDGQGRTGNNSAQGDPSTPYAVIWINVTCTGPPIPEFSTLIIPILAIIVLFAIYSSRVRFKSH